MNLLLNKFEGHTGECWPVMAVWTEHSEVHKNDQWPLFHSTAHQARLVDYMVLKFEYSGFQKQEIHGS